MSGAQAILDKSWWSRAKHALHAKRDDWFRELGPLLVLALLIVVFTALDRHFLTVDNWLNIARQGAVLLVVAIAGTFVILMGSVDLSVGSVLTISAIVGAVILRETGSPFLLVLVPILGLGLGAVNGLIFAYGRLPSFLVTLGTLFAFDGISLFICNGTPISLASSSGLGYAINGSLIWRIPNLAIFALIVCGIAVFAAERTRFGRYMYAIGDGERVALLSGVNVRRYKLYAFMIGGMLSSIAGMMLMFRVNSGSPRIGEPFLLTSLAAIVMGGTPLSGGVGGPHRTLLGVLIVTVLTNGMDIADVGPYLQIVVKGLVVILAVALTLDRRKLLVVK